MVGPSAAFGATDVTNQGTLRVVQPFADTSGFTETFPSTHSDAHVSVNLTTGKITVTDCPISITTVGSVIGEALGEITIDVNQLSVAARNAAGQPIEFNLTAQDVATLADGLILNGTASGPTYNGAFTVELDPTNPVVTTALGATASAEIVQAAKDEWNTIPARTALLAPVPVGQALENLSGSLDGQTLHVDFPYAFAYDFGTALTNGTEATLTPSEVFSNITRYPLNGNLSGHGQFKNAKVSDVFSPAAIAAIGANANQPLYQLILASLPGAWGNADVANALDSVVNQLLTDMLGAAPSISTTTATGHTLTATPNSASLKARATELLKEKLAGQWGEDIMDVLTGNANLDWEIDPGTLQRLAADDVTEVQRSVTWTNGTNQSHSIVVGGHKGLPLPSAPALAPLAVSPLATPTYQFQSADPATVSVDGNGVVYGLKAGTTTVTVTATYACPLVASQTITKTVTHTVTVEAATTTPPPTPSPTVSGPTSPTGTATGPTGSGTVTVSGPTVPSASATGKGTLPVTGPLGTQFMILFGVAIAAAGTLIVRKLA
ncbi:MAG: hypothetical protein LBR19_09420, partial [Bifidobacteriaceae bacterium]|nr:hypothetical protein [Bifidobacteriaceae bacterium]